MAADLRDWILEVTGASDVRLERVPGGGSRQAWFVDLSGGDEFAPGPASHGLFLRYDPRTPQPGSAFHTLQVEAEILRALHRNGACVPRVVAAHPRHQAMLQERVPGRAWFYLIEDEAEKVQIAKNFIAELAATHRIDPCDLAIESFGPVRSVREHVRDEIAGIRRRAAAKREPQPLLDFCVDWLERNIPDYDGPPVLVQGDTGPGNFLYQDGAVTAVVDWELAHYGDPMDDIAWLSLRCAQDPFPDFPGRIAEYERLSGHRIDPQRVWYYRLLAEAKLATFHDGPVDARVSLRADSPDAGNNLIYGMLHRRMLVEALAHAVGLDASRMDLSPAESDSGYQAVYEATLQALRHGAEQSKDPLAGRWVKGAARLVKYLREVDLHGPDIDRGEREELTELLGFTPDSLAAGRAELSRLVRAGDLDELDYIARMWRCVQRDDYLARTASGALYHRTWPPLS